MVALGTEPSLDTELKCHIFIIFIILVQNVDLSKAKINIKFILWYYKTNLQMYDLILLLIL